MKKKYVFFILCLLLIFSIINLNCTGTNGGSSSTYIVEYDGNDYTNGSVPIDSNFYKEGEIVTVAVPGTMTRTGYAFTGWNTIYDGSGINISGVPFEHCYP